MNETNKETKMNEKKYRLDQIAICNFTQDHIFPKREAKKMDGLVFCSPRCKDGYKRERAYNSEMGIG